MIERVDRVKPEIMVYVEETDHATCSEVLSFPTHSE